MDSGIDQKNFKKLGAKNINFIGADVVEISPPFDVNNITSLVGANIAFEILCALTRTN